MGAFESLQGCFSHNMDLVLHLLVSNRECLYIGASLSISWTTPCCLVLISSYYLLSLAHFLPRVLDSLIFLSQHIDADWSSIFEDVYSSELDFRIFV